MAHVAGIPDRVYQDESGSYQLPKDGPEHDRLDGQSSALVRLMGNRPFHAPIRRPQRILDVGCGTASMTNLLAAVFPTAEVIGIDIAAVPETRHGKLDNVTYIQGDVRELMGVHPNLQLGSFDYVFQRLLVFGMTDWQHYIASIATLVKPGGYLEVQEAVMALYSSAGDPISDSWWWYPRLVSDAQAIGLDVEIGSKLRNYLDTTPGIQNVQGQMYRFAPKQRDEAPELAGLEGQISGLFAFIIRKISGQQRSEEFVDNLEKDMKTIWEKGFQPGDHHRMFVAVGQRS